MKKICLCCLEEVENNKICSNCRIARYCSVQCQRKHWPLHKKMCIDSNCEFSAEKLCNKALNCQNQGNYPKAEKLFRKSLIILRQHLGEDDSLTLHPVENLAEILSRQKKHEESIELFQECLGKRQSLLGKNHPKTIKTMGFLACAYGEQGSGESIDRAAVLYRSCYQMQKSLLGENHPETLKNMGYLAWALSIKGHFAEADVLFQKCLDIQKSVLGINHNDTLRTVENVAKNFYLQKQYDAAAVVFKELFDAQKVVQGENHPFTLRAMYLLALTLFDTEKFDEAIGLFRNCLARQKLVLGKNHRDTLKTESILKKML